MLIIAITIQVTKWQATFFTTPIMSSMSAMIRATSRRAANQDPVTNSKMEIINVKKMSTDPAIIMPVLIVQPQNVSVLQHMVDVLMIRFSANSLKRINVSSTGRSQNQAPEIY